MSLTSETPQVGSQTDLISLLRSTDVDRAVQAAAEPRKPSRPERAGAVTVAGTVFFPISRRGLRNKVVLVRECPHCGDPHQFRDSGLRLASCGLGYVIVRGRRARRPTPRKCQQESVSPESVNSADTCEPSSVEPATCIAPARSPSEALPESVSADSCAENKQGVGAVIEP